MFWFLELEEKLALFGQNHFHVSLAHNSRVVELIFIVADELLALMLVLFGEISLCFRLP